MFWLFSFLNLLASNVIYELTLLMIPLLLFFGSFVGGSGSAKDIPEKLFMFMMILLPLLVILCFPILSYFFREWILANKKPALLIPWTMCIVALIFLLIEITLTKNYLVILLLLFLTPIGCYAVWILIILSIVTKLNIESK